MDIRSIAIWIFIGLVAGWLASFVVGGGGLGRYLITGLIGSVVGGVLLQTFGVKLGIENDVLRQVIVASIGAIVVVLIARLLA